MTVTDPAVTEPAATEQVLPGGQDVGTAIAEGRRAYELDRRHGKQDLLPDHHVEHGRSLADSDIQDLGKTIDMAW